MPKRTGKQLCNDGVETFVVLDFDGVLNAMTNGTFPKQLFGKLEHFNQAVFVDGGLRLIFPITYSTEMIDRLNTLLADQVTQLCWLTSWREQVLEPAKKMGLMSARPPVIVGYLETRESNQDGKPAGLDKFLAGVPDDAKVVWVDDTLHNGASLFHTQLVEYYLRERLHQRFLLIGPDERYGISRDQMGEIEDFVNGSD